MPILQLRKLELMWIKKLELKRPFKNIDLSDAKNPICVYSTTLTNE